MRPASTGLVAPYHRPRCTNALFDAHYGFITFHVWVLWKERRSLPRALWFVAIMLLGNIAMSAYVLRQLARLGAADSMSTLLSARNP